VGNDPVKSLSRMAVQALLADAERALTLAGVGEVGENREIVAVTMANARHNYDVLMRRRRPLMLTHAEEVRFQNIMARLQARIRFFEQSS
jgi:hypothetical protein